MTRRTALSPYWIIVGAVLACLIHVAHSQQAPAPHPATAASAKPPTITDAQKAAYWKSQSEMQAAYAKVQQAQEEARQKQLTSNDQVEAIRKACGSDFLPSLNTQGDVECVAKPPAKP
jgi:hypothetical protein